MIWERFSQKAQFGNQKLTFREKTGEIEPFYAAKRSLGYVWWINWGFEQNSPLLKLAINSGAFFHPEKKSLWRHFDQVFGIFCGLFGPFYALGDKYVVLLGFG